MTRRAISPRLAMSTFEIIVDSVRLDGEERLAKFDRLRVLRIDLDDDAVNVRFDLVHQLHRFDNAENLPFADAAADLNELRRIRTRRAIERSDDRRSENVRARRWRLRRACLRCGGGFRSCR